MDELCFENSDLSLVDGNKIVDIQIYCMQTVCKMVLGRKKIRVPIPIPAPSCVIAVIRQKVYSSNFVGFKYPQV